jgi:hypothetical protein
MTRLSSGVQQIARIESKSMRERRRIKNSSLDALDLARSSLMTVIFSDSVLIVSSDDSRGSLYNMILTATWLASYCLQRAVPIKGVVASGTMTFDSAKSIYCGRPLIDAYTLQDDMQVYGVALHHTVEAYMRRWRDAMALPFGRRSLEIPMRSGIATHTILDWTDAIMKSEEELDQVIGDVLNDLYETVSGSARRYVDNTASYTSELVSLHRKEVIERSTGSGQAHKGSGPVTAARSKKKRRTT